MKENQKELTPSIFRLKETNSTNVYLHELLERGEASEGTLVVADYQTAGKGQVGNKWESDAGKNLLFSIMLEPDFLPANRQFLISQITALSVKKTYDNYIGDVSIKWPNDIYYQEKKICGMLIENELSGMNLNASIIGIGMNVNQEEFRSDAPNPVSLFQITGKEYDREELLKHFLEYFFYYYNSLINGEEEMIRTAYRKALYRGTGYNLYKDKNGQFEAELFDIEPTGHLILKLHDGTKCRYAFKEVSFVH